MLGGVEKRRPIHALLPHDAEAGASLFQRKRDLPTSDGNLALPASKDISFVVFYACLLGYSNDQYPVVAYSLSHTSGTCHLGRKLEGGHIGIDDKYI